MHLATCEICLLSANFLLNVLRWHICRVNCALKIVTKYLFELRIFLRKMLRYFPRIVEPLFCGSEKILKNPAIFPPNFPAKKSKKSQGRIVAVSRTKARKNPPKNPRQNSPGNSFGKIPLGFLQKPFLEKFTEELLQERRENNVC